MWWCLRIVLWKESGARATSISFPVQLNYSLGARGTQTCVLEITLEEDSRVWDAAAVLSMSAAREVLRFKERT